MSGPLDDFMARGARMRGVQIRPSRFKQGHTDALWLGTREIAADVERAIELLRRATRAAGV